MDTAEVEVKKESDYLKKDEKTKYYERTYDIVIFANIERTFFSFFLYLHTHTLSHTLTRTFEKHAASQVGRVWCV
jgi:hypothetical protein